MFQQMQLSNAIQHKRKTNCSFHKYILVTFLMLSMLLILSGCGKENHIRNAKILVENPAEYAENMEVQQNLCGDLSVPTYLTKVDNTYFIVDCYHNQVIYHDNLSDPLTEWSVMTNDVSLAHTLASDGTIYMIDDTENNRIVIFEKVNDKFVNTQCFNDVGIRPHYVIYNEANKTFYAWSSMTGEMYLFKKEKNSSHMYLSEILSIPSLNNVYVRSFTIVGDEIYFVSGNSSIIKCKLNNLELIEEYPVPDSMAGMIQITPVEDEFLITISTDVTGNQDFATMIQVKDLASLSIGVYQDVYHNFIGGGTPYYITKLDNMYYLTEHRLPGHSIWSFEFENGTIQNVCAIY